MSSGVNATQAKTRLLLALWELGGTNQEVKKGIFTRRIVSKGQKLGDYQGILEELEKIGAIAISRTGYKLTSDKGLQALGEGLQKGELEFKTNVGAWVGNALVRWIGQQPAVSNAVVSSDDGKPALISSYEEFKSVALEVYDKLNKNYNLDDLVPIYRIRREIGDRVSRENFNTWLREMQSDDIVQFQGGSLSDSDPAKIEDSITTPVNGLRCYVKRLT